MNSLKGTICGEKPIDVFRVRFFADQSVCNATPRLSNSEVHTYAQSNRADIEKLTINSYVAANMFFYNSEIFLYRVSV